MNPADLATTAVHIVGPIANAPRNGGSPAQWIEVLLTCVGIVTAYLAYRPKMTKVENERLNSLDGARASDMVEMRKDQHEMRALVTTLTSRVNAYELRVGQLEFGLRIAMDELERLAPEGNPIARQLRSYLGAVSPLPSGITQEQMELLRSVKSD